MEGWKDGWMHGWMEQRSGLGEGTVGRGWAGERSGEEAEQRVCGNFLAKYFFAPGKHLISDPPSARRAPVPKFNMWA